MSLKTEIIPYLTVDGYVCPNTVSPGTIRGCDNQPLFTSVYYMLLNRNKELLNSDTMVYYNLIKACVGSDGYLHRAPGDSSPDTVDDHYGVLAGFAEFKLKPCFKLPIALWRQPQLLYAYLLAIGVPSLAMLPLSAYNAIVLAIANINDPGTDSGSRQLTWALWQATKAKSVLASIWGKIWHKRQIGVYHTTEIMKAVAAIYYQKGHPFAKYFVD